MASQHVTGIPKGSLMLITGATSYLASYTIKEFLERGYRVRGVVRKLTQAAWLTEEVFPSYAQSGIFDLVEVPDLAASNAWDSVVPKSGASAILHFATPFDFSADPNEVIPKAVGTLLGLLRAAAQENSVQKFVYTSTVGSAYSPRGGIPAVVTKDSWNDAVLGKAWAPPPYEPQRGIYVYAASKVETERAMLKFMQEENPKFSASSVNPFTVMGPALHKRHLKGTGGWIRNIYNGEPGLVAVLLGACQVNVQDIAVLHVAAALDPDVKGERLFAWAEAFNLNTLLAILRHQYPDRTFIKDGPVQPLCLATIGNERRVLELLKKWGGRDGWIPLEETVRDGMILEP